MISFARLRRGVPRTAATRGARKIFEYRGRCVHAKTLWVITSGPRGSSNLNVSSLLGNYELDLVAEHDGLTRRLAKQFLHGHGAERREIVLMRVAAPLPPRLIAAAAGQDPFPAAQNAPSGSAGPSPSSR